MCWSDHLLQNIMYSHTALRKYFCATQGLFVEFGVCHIEQLAPLIDLGAAFDPQIL